MQINIINNKISDKCCHKNNISKEDIILAFESYFAQYNNQSYKIKVLKDITYNGQLIYEFKVLIKKKYFRIGYTINSDEVLIILITDQIVKSIFLKEIKKIKNIK